MVVRFTRIMTRERIIVSNVRSLAVHVESLSYLAVKSYK